MQHLGLGDIGLKQGKVKNSDIKPDSSIRRKYGRCYINPKAVLGHTTVSPHPNSSNSLYDDSQPYGAGKNSLSGTFCCCGCCFAWTWNGSSAILFDSRQICQCRETPVFCHGFLLFIPVYPCGHEYLFHHPSIDDHYDRNYVIRQSPSNVC